MSFEARSGSERGQALALLLPLLPVLLGAAALLYYVMAAGNGQAKAEASCQAAALAHASAQARGLAALARLNEIALPVAELRLRLERILLASTLQPAARAALQSTIESLKKAQSAIEALQEAIQARAVGGAKREGRQAMGDPGFFRVIRESPSFPGGPHALADSLILHVRKIDRFKHMGGAPLRLDEDFHARQTASYVLEVDPRALVEAMLGLPKPGLLEVGCKARVEMARLEEKWKVALMPVDRPSSSWRSRRLSLSSRP